ncbi:bifunctional serine/threonine-protein kinase/formylglycine-generating enzyme family protein [Gilvimarinus agarilyticus]|uniref:bifunctional serine/threonine-protein kinase/formylglycine-generating enzyme family protein n=1 Tax=Gilvimarinus agarilyticus TaxID=679259 RepID=UPI0005A2C7C5|nr:bifunctional serine/threonine-protein kinase/formylglycine-generating enzyme family protein [Gilvimarinus agarilyticus]
MYIPGYRIIRKINHGGMSTVYLAIQESVGRVVALKVMSPALNGDPSFSERFQREANIVGQLSHPNIVSIYDIGRHESLNYIAMDYLPGGSIHDKMLTGIEPDAALEILREMASALGHAHEKGYIHRDIKPENILFRDGGSAVLTDFGVALARNSGPRATHAGTVVGTPHYMSPEQTRGKNADGRSDLYSLGIVFYEMLTGAVPYQGDEAVAIALKHLASPLPKLPAQYRRYQDILNKLLDKEPDKRYQTGRELVVDIELLQLKMRELGDGDGDGQNLSHQFQALTHTIGWRLANSTKSISHQLWSNLRGLRFSREQGFHQVEPEQVALGDYPTRQNTLVATQFQKSAQATLRFSWLLNRPKQQRWLATGVVLLLGLFVIIWLFNPSSPPPEAPTLAEDAKPQGSATIAWQADQTNNDELTGNQELHAAASEASADTAGENAASITDTATQFSSQASTDAITDNGGRIRQSADADAPNLPEETSDTLAVSSELTLESSNAARSTEAEQGNELNEADDLTLALADSSDPETESNSASAAKFSFTVNPEPSNARIRIMNIRAKYTPGIELKPGRYQVEVTAPGYRKYLQWVTLDQQPLTKTVSLREQREVGSVFSSTLSGNTRGPSMIVVPAGQFPMGGPDNNSQPVHKVNINNRFAVSQHEITFDQYELFAKRKGMPLPGDNRWGRGDRPVINVSWEEADMYAKWLSEQTGMRYRLPTEAEWEYLAKGGKAQEYVWGNNAKDAAGYANCRRYCDSEFTGFFSGKTAPVGSYKANDFGVFDMAGNVAEWVADCYREGYQGNSPSAEAYQQANCPARVVRGGSLKSDAGDTNTYSRQFQPQHTYHEDVGFRLVVELNN